MGQNFWEKTLLPAKITQRAFYSATFCTFSKKLYLVGGINYDKEGGGRIALDDVLIIEDTEETYSVTSVKIATSKKYIYFKLFLSDRTRR